ncbi:MAG: septum formation initiator family protein [Terriglobales bacterium]
MDLRIVARNDKANDAAEAARSWLFRWRRRLATIAVCLIALFLGFRVVSGPNGWLAYHNKKVENQRLKQQVEALQKENEELERRVKALKSDPKAIEKEAREQLRYARPGEVIYVLPQPKPAPAPQPPANATAEKSGKP